MAATSPGASPRWRARQRGEAADGQRGKRKLSGKALAAGGPAPPPPAASALPLSSNAQLLNWRVGLMNASIFGET